MALVTLPSALLASKNCWKQAYGRGLGEVISTCRDGLDRNLGLCYEGCAPGFYGVGPVCWQYCPSEFRDDGCFCYKPEAYGRGAGYAIWSEGWCNDDNRDVGCEIWGAMYYPRCRQNYHNVACCICSPDCPSGMTDIGISCAKDSYGRGVGEPLICAPELDMSGLLCYP